MMLHLLTINHTLFSNQTLLIKKYIIKLKQNITIKSFIIRVFYQKWEINFFYYLSVGKSSIITKKREKI